MAVPPGNEQDEVALAQRVALCSLFGMPLNK
jgi:hypothetical protein